MINKDQKIEESLNSLDNIQRAEAGAFFYTRVLARLEKRQGSAWERISSLISRPLVAVSGLCLVVVLNMAVVVTRTSDISVASDTPEIAAADAYTLATTSFYDYENQETR